MKSRSDFDLEKIAQKVSHWLPQQGPIKDFVHHNTLHAFQHVRFHQAVRMASSLYDAKCFMPLSFYQERFKLGAITESALERALSTVLASTVERDHVKQNMFLPEASPSPRAERPSIRRLWNMRLKHANLDNLIQPPTFRLIGGYLDQGLSTWRMPGADELDFFSAVQSLVQTSWVPFWPLNLVDARLFSAGAHQAALSALERLVDNPDLYESYILDMLLAQPGWAGLVAQCERHPDSLLSPRRIRLLDYIAVSLLIEVACVESVLGAHFQPLSIPPLSAFKPPDSIPQNEEKSLVLRVWHEAFEWSYYESLLGGISCSKPKPQEHIPRSAWAFFCIDDRECSLRRHVEEMDRSIETFATAGFFGLDFMYKGSLDAVPGKHCPVLVTPKHLIIEEIDEPRKVTRRPRWLQKIFPLEPQSNTFFRGWILSYALGLGAGIRLAFSVFKPSLNRVSVPPLSTVNQKARLRLSRADNQSTEGGLWMGYSCSELADRVLNLLQSTGALKHWPELVVFFGHGSSSVNNPYFSAYNCGACSGRPGAPNARAFAEAANLPEVRSLLARQGVDIPNSTWFVGALHDTCQDTVVYYDVDRIPEKHLASFSRFQNTIQSALARNARERCRRFDIVRRNISDGDALKEVRTRAVSLFEPRPEYNHATNAACIIGRRSLTEDMFLDRRAFLSSYDPMQDPSGEILTSQLSAVIPVCAGINLEYLFSRVDPVHYGAGTKLSHNVNALIGVSNGVEGDLLTGLPTQMTEIHDPIRLILVVEQTPEVALASVEREAKVREWVDNDWIRFACVHPNTREIWFYESGVMNRITELPSPPINWANSLEAAARGGENLPIGIVRSPKGRLQ